MRQDNQRNPFENMIREFQGHIPEFGEGCFVAETAAVIGDVRIGRDSSVWYSAVIRADSNSIEIGERVSIQDGTVVHVSGGKSGNVRIGNDIIIGHNANVHGCTVCDKCLIGMGATVLDGAVINEGSVIAAGALVLANTIVGPYEMWAGVPAVFVKKTTPAAVERTIMKGVAEYVELAKEYGK